VVKTKVLGLQAADKEFRPERFPQE